MSRRAVNNNCLTALMVPTSHPYLTSIRSIAQIRSCLLYCVLYDRDTVHGPTRGVVGVVGPIAYRYATLDATHATLPTRH
jgi:hypothetical protein